MSKSDPLSLPQCQKLAQAHFEDSDGVEGDGALAGELEEDEDDGDRHDLPADYRRVWAVPLQLLCPLLKLCERLQVVVVQLEHLLNAYCAFTLIK